MNSCFKAKEFLEIEASGASATQWSLADFEDELRSEVSKVFLFFVAGEARPAGFVFYREQPSEVWVVHLAVRDKGRGHGACMMEEFLKELSMRSVSSVGLEVRETNSQALKLYLKLGFKEIARRPNYYRCGENAIVMKRS